MRRNPVLTKNHPKSLSHENNCQQSISELEQHRHIRGNTMVKNWNLTRKGCFLIKITITIIQNFKLQLPIQPFNRNWWSRIMNCSLISFKRHTVSGRMNRLFHALVSPLASFAFLFSSLCFLRVLELWSFKTLFL